MRILINAIAGIIFGLGLLVSGMINPAKVLNFLDVAGTWDPSLAFVMAGAIAVALPGYRLVLLRHAPLLGERFRLPTRARVDARLVLGSVIFGAGWGLGGFCPGPAIASVPLLAKGTIAFVASMVIGAALVRALAWSGDSAAELRTGLDQAPAGSVES